MFECTSECIQMVHFFMSSYQTNVFHGALAAKSMMFQIDVSHVLDCGWKTKKSTMRFLNFNCFFFFKIMSQLLSDTIPMSQPSLDFISAMADAISLLMFLDWFLSLGGKIQVVIVISYHYQLKRCLIYHWDGFSNRFHLVWIFFFRSQAHVNEAGLWLWIRVIANVNKGDRSVGPRNNIAILTFLTTF